METGGLAVAENSIMNESFSKRVKLVNILRDQLTFVRNIFSDKVVSAEGHTYSNDAIRDKNPVNVDEFAEVRERVISMDHVRIQLEDSDCSILGDEDLGLCTVLDILKNMPVSSGTSRVSRARRGSMTLSFAVR